MALAEAVPPWPVHCRVKVVVIVTDPTASEPDTNFVPLQPPDAWHVSALVLDQVSVVVPPDAMFGRLRLELHGRRRRVVAASAAAATGEQRCDDARLRFAWPRGAEVVDALMLDFSWLRGRVCESYPYGQAARFRRRCRRLQGGEST